MKGINECYFCLDLCNKRGSVDTLMNDHSDKSTNFSNFGIALRKVLVVIVHINILIVFHWLDFKSINHYLNSLFPHFSLALYITYIELEPHLLSVVPCGYIISS